MRMLLPIQESIMGGRPYKSGLFALSLRQRIFSEHLGLTTLEAAQDPVADAFWQVSANSVVGTPPCSRLSTVPCTATPNIEQN